MALEHFRMLNNEFLNKDTMEEEGNLTNATWRILITLNLRSLKTSRKILITT